MLLTLPIGSRGILLLAGILLLTALPLSAQDVPRTPTFPGLASSAFPYAQPEEVDLSSEKLDRLGEEITEWIAAGELVGAELLIIKDGRAVFHEAYGWSDLAERRPMERGSVFSIMSMSKPFTATAILMLEEQGKLSLDDSVSRYVPGFAGDERTTIRHLLSHTSGYDSEHGLGGEEFRYGSLRDWVEVWAAEEPAEPFGEYSYSDFNFAVLGYIVEELQGRPVEDFIETRVIEPLGLNDTYTAFSPDARWAERMNSRHRWDEEAGAYERYWSNEDDWPFPFYPAGWGLFSTAMDYAAFLAMWMEKGGWNGTHMLSEATVEEALRPHAETPHKGYGYGWQVRYAPRVNEMPPVFYHGGWDGTLAMALPAEDALVLYLTHSRGRDHRDAFRNRLGRFEIFDHPGPYDSYLVWAGDREVDEVDLPAEKQAMYVGTYRANETVYRVWEEDSRLHIRRGGTGERADLRYHLVPFGDHRFAPGRYRNSRLVAIDPIVELRFEVEDGEATAMEVLADDRALFSAPRAQ